MNEHAEHIENASNYISHLISSLGNSYDLLYTQNVDLKALGEAVDGLIYVNTKLIEQKTILDERLAKLRAQSDQISS